MVTRVQVKTYGSKMDEAGFDELTVNGQGIGREPGNCGRAENSPTRVGNNPTLIRGGTGPGPDQEVVKIL